MRLNTRKMNSRDEISSRKVCRTCLKQYDSRKSLISLLDFDQTCPQENVKFCEMLAIISNQTVSENDELPNRVCIMCISQIRTSYHFKIQVDECHRKLCENLRLRQKCLESYRVPVIKQEPNASMPLILAPRTLNEEALSDTENMLEELQHTGDRDEAHSENEIIDYEPEVNESERLSFDEVASQSAEKSDKSKSPDSGISASTSDNKSERRSENLPAATCNNCHRVFDSTKALLLHKRGKACSAKNCRYCGKRFGNVAQLKMHTRYKHPDNYNEVKLNYQEAVVRVEKVTEFNKCCTCSVILVDRIALLRHHADCDSKCIECGLKIPRRDFYFKHLETAHKININPAALECPFCMNAFYTERVLQEHIQRLHPDETQSENQSFTDTLSEAGESTSNEGFLYECQLCPARFKTPKSLNQHKSIKHKDAVDSRPPPSKVSSNSVKKYTKDEFIEKFLVKRSDDLVRCLPCQKDVVKRSLLLHLKTKHAAVRPHRCELCPDGFFRADYRQRHCAAVHPNDYRCDECDLQFDRAFKFDLHMAQHGVAQKRFKPSDGNDPYDLSPHEIRYIEDATNYDYTNDELEIQTNGEEAAANTTEALMTKEEFCERYMTSVNDVMVNCDVCQQEIQKASIQSHLMWKHAVKKPFKCPFCNERVVKNHARLSHMARCHPDCYKCGECKVQFAKHSLFVDHMREHHFVSVTTPASSGEEEDIPITDMRFVTNPNEDEVIVEPDSLRLESGVPQERKYACFFCAKTFTTSRNLLIHKSHKHRNEMRESLNATADTTSDTSDASMTFEEFQSNWVETLNDVDMKCLVCDQVLKKRSLIPHLKSKHCTTGAYLCAICPEKFFRPEQRVQHMSQCHRGIFNCSTCNIQFYRNSRYAKHMNEVHEIDLDATDNYEVDLNVCDLRFEAIVRGCSDDNNLLPAIVHESIDESDPIEEMMQQLSAGGEMSRNEFIRRYIRGTGSSRRCDACDRSFLHTSMYHHIIHFHAVILPFKCPFCDVRFERSYTRNRHLQLFHPNEYKCFECGLQFPKHARYSEHMASEHNVAVTTPKSPHEEDDLTSTDIKYVRSKSSEEWQEMDDVPIGNSTMVSDYNELPQQSFVQLQQSQIKSEPTEERQVVSQAVEQPCEELFYDDFKTKYLKKQDKLTVKCLACTRTIIRTSVCAHLRLWHAVTMMFKCELCDIGFRRSDYRQRHMAANHPNDYKCIKCDMQFHYSSLYKEHMFEAHRLPVNVQMVKPRDEVDVPLEKMKFAASVPDSMRIHPSDETSKRGRRLSVCTDPILPNDRGMTYNEFSQKYFKEIGLSMFQCIVCNETLTKFALKKHSKRFHATTKPFYCELCDEGFYRLDERLTHMRDSHHGSFTCFPCNVQFYWSENYVEHMQNTHNASISVSTDKELTEIDVPIQRLRFVAQRIGGPVKTATIKTEKPTNQRAVQSINIEVADDAEMTREQFSKKFLRNFRSANSDLMMRCLACNKQFGAKQKMFHLLHNHVIERPFGCELCTARFYTNFKRVKHVEAHHPNDFRCQICSTQYERSKLYVDHMLLEHRITVKTAETSNPDISYSDLRYLKNRKKLIYRTPHESDSMIDVHEAGSSVTEVNYCEICCIDFDSARSYRQHIRDHGNGTEPLVVVKEEKPEEKPELKREYSFQCEICEKKFLALYALNTHKKFKHKNGGEFPKRKCEKQKFEIDCQMCSFSSFRRDYVEHHIRQCHKLEFQCRICMRVCSNYNFYAYHLFKYHNIREDASKYFKCDECDVFFKFEENLQKHKSARHGDKTPKRNFYCNSCHVDFRSKTHLDSHTDMYLHKHMLAFLTNPEECVFGEENSTPALPPPQQPTPSSAAEESETTVEEPPEKRQKTDESVEMSDDDKLDYLKYMHVAESGHFKCGICGKTKLLRKHMLHHLKQHKEVPTYECNMCPERFVFRKKYQQHLEMHSSVCDATLVENEHPKFQGSNGSGGAGKRATSDIQCTICSVTFKLTIMLNKHNSIWHEDGNANKHLSMSEQKSLQRSGSDASRSNADKVSCEKCKLTFNDPKFLENHQKLFCVHRNQPRSEEEIINEQ